jgi:hypothetical protein
MTAVVNDVKNLATLIKKKAVSICGTGCLFVFTSTP